MSDTPIVSPSNECHSDGQPPPPYTLLHTTKSLSTFQEGYPTYLQPTTPQVVCVTEDILERLQRDQARRNRQFEVEQTEWADCFIFWWWLTSCCGRRK